MLLSRYEIEAAPRSWHPAWADHKDGRIIRKLAYSKTTLEIVGQRVHFVPEHLP